MNEIKLIKYEKNIAVIGCGHWGKNLIKIFMNLGLHSICDLDTEAANCIANKYNVKNLSFKVIENEDIQGVVLAVPAQCMLNLECKQSKLEKMFLLKNH